MQKTGSILPDVGNLTSDPEQNGRDRLPESEENPNYGDQVINSIRGCKPFSLSEVARPVFVNHYYAGEPLVLVMKRKLIRLEECDIPTENSVKNSQLQCINCQCVEHLQNSVNIQQR